MVSNRLCMPAADGAPPAGQPLGKSPPGVSFSRDLYTVTELGRELGVSARTIRFYEDKGLLSPGRVGNNRVYAPRDRARMILILRGKQLGFSLREIKDYLDLYDVDPTHGKQIGLLLKAVQTKIAGLEEQRIALDQTLEELRGVQAEARAALSTLENNRRNAFEITGVTS